MMTKQQKINKEKLTKNEKINIILKLFFIFLIPTTALLCLVLFYIDLMHLLMEHGIILRHNLVHAGATLTLIFYLSWRPFHWLTYEMKKIYHDLKKREDDERTD